MKKPLILLALAGAAILGWFFVSPLFIDEAVDEPLILPTRAAVDAMGEAERAKLMDDLMDRMQATGDSGAEDPMDTRFVDAPVAYGRFTDADAIHKGSGSVAVYALADGGHLLRLEDFRVTNGPALSVMLARHPAPTRAGDVLGQGYVEIAHLKGNVGNQNYLVPATVDLDDYNSVVIWCRLFDVLFSPASLTHEQMAQTRD